MIMQIKFNEKTSDENQMFLLDINKHQAVVPYIPEPKIDLSKYNGFEFYGLFLGYSRIDVK
jgi:hypothetical protein